MQYSWNGGSIHSLHKEIIVISINIRGGRSRCLIDAWRSPVLMILLVWRSYAQQVLNYNCNNDSLKLPVKLSYSPSIFWLEHCKINWLQNLQISQKQAAAKQCKCTMADVENTLAKYTWAKEAQFKLQKLKEEGKPMPKSMAEVSDVFPQLLFLSSMLLFSISVIFCVIVAH